MHTMCVNDDFCLQELSGTGISTEGELISGWVV